MKKWIYIFIAVCLVAGFAVAISVSADRSRNNSDLNQNNPQVEAKLEAPEFTVRELASGLTKVWDVAVLSGGTIIYSERSGRIGAVVDGQKRVLATPADVISRGEGGLLGLTIDPDFAQNRYLYTCMNSSAGGSPDVRVVRWTVNQDVTGLTNRKDIITGLPVNRLGQAGRHSGCRPRFGNDGFLWVATGDAATASAPQDPKSLGGKILRVDRDGQPAPGNLKPPFDARIYSYGHRNLQGLAFRAEDSSGPAGYSVEHGPDVDDEINPLKSGNFGWDPLPPYNENVPMTDLEDFPNAIKAAWSSGRPTVAPSGATFIQGKQWKSWEGYLAVAYLKGKQLQLFKVEGGRVKPQMAILEDRGRLRGVVQGPDGDLYVTTDNGGGEDVILRLSPKS